ncbi:hypothetical protein ABIB25_005338 [Nakamurella sp. UYEF19]|uniref:SRPBCC family protein n=1 Tax=Nakamurella sp. UYEF19 TaxID=1756392 RepID=UPI003390CF9C
MRTTSAPPERLWAWYEATDRAPEWDPLIGRIRPDGPFALGATGRNKPRTGPSVRYVVTEYEQQVSYIEVSRAPGASMAFGHRITDCGGGRWRVRHDVVCAGPLSAVYRLVLSRSYRTGMASALDGLIRLAEASGPHDRS